MAESRLPVHPAECIALAADDFESCLADPQVVVDMNEWYRLDGGGTCAVCLAGACLRQEFDAITAAMRERAGLSDSGSAHARISDLSVERRLSRGDYSRLLFLNMVRGGDLNHSLTILLRNSSMVGPSARAVEALLREVANAWAREVVAAAKAAGEAAPVYIGSHNGALLLNVPRVSSAPFDVRQLPYMRKEYDRFVRYLRYLVVGGRAVPDVLWEQLLPHLEK